MTDSADSLRAALNFSEADLAANRQGRLSPAQAQRIKKNQRRTVAIAGAAFLTLVLLASALIFLGQTETSPIAEAAGFALILINALMIGHVGRGVMRAMNDLRRGSIELLEGEVERVLRRGHRTDSCLLKIAGQELAVAKEVFIHFSHMQAYRVYRSRHGRVLLSAEPVCQRIVDEERRAMLE